MKNNKKEMMVPGKNHFKKYYDNCCEEVNYKKVIISLNLSDKDKQFIYFFMSLKHKIRKKRKFLSLYLERKLSFICNNSILCVFK